MKTKTSLYNDWLLGLKFFYRERQTPALRILLIALASATFIMMVLNGLNDHAWRTLYQKASVAFGAHLIVDSHKPLESSLKQQAQSLGLKNTEVTKLLTMGRGGERFQLLSLKGVGPGYPLLGEVTLSNQSTQITVSSPPKLGTVWVERGVLNQLSLEVGDDIIIGEKTFKITYVIEQEPESAGTLVLIAPRVIIALEDLISANVLQPGSRADYEIWFSGPEQTITSMRNWVIQQQNINWEIESLSDGNSPIQRFMGYAQGYLGLIILLTVLLAGLSVSLSARFWIRQRVKMIALYKVLGAQPSRILRIIVFGFISFGVVIVLGALVLGQIVTMALVVLSQSWIPSEPFQFAWAPALLSFTIGMFILLGFSLPEVLWARKVPPKWILRGQAIEWPISILFYGVVLLLCVGLLYFYVKQLHLTLILVAGLGWAAFVAYLILYGFLALLGRYSGRYFTLRYALRQLSFRMNETAQQVVAFTLVLVSVLVLWGAQNDFLSSWQAQLPTDTPNHFLINIPPDEIQPVKSLIEGEIGRSVEFYPIVRGRLTHIKGEQVRMTADDPGPRGVGRPLNLTWMNTLPEDNPIVEGPEWDENVFNQPFISMEQRFASRLGVGLGDTVAFEVAGEKVEGTIYNIRTVEWQSFKPNFFVIFPKGYLENLPSMAITSFYVPSGQTTLVQKLNQQYPEITIIQVDKIIKEVQSLLEVLVKGIQALLFLVLVFTLMIFYVILMASMPQRTFDSAMIRLVGGSTGLIRRVTLMEFALLGAVTGLVGIGASQWIIYQLAHQIFDLPYVFHGTFLVGIWCLTLVVLVGAGWLTLRQVPKQSPLQLLRSS